MYNAFILVNLHLNDFCVITTCFMSHLMNSWMSIWGLNIECLLSYVKLLILIFLWPYIDDYETMILKRTWIYNLNLVIYYSHFLNIWTCFWPLKLHNFNFFFKDFFFLLRKGGEVSFSRRLDIFYVGLLIYMVNLNYFILKWCWRKVCLVQF
jgi:hypothetical protein